MTETEGNKAEEAIAAEKTEEAPKFGHPKVASLLVGIASLLVFVAIFSVWVNRQALDTDNWVDTSSKVLENSEVQAQLSDYLTAELFDNVDVEAELAKELPPPVQGLAGPAAGGLRQLAPQAIGKALATPAVQTVWADANRVASTALLRVLEGDGQFLSNVTGAVATATGAQSSVSGAAAKVDSAKSTVDSVASGETAAPAQVQEVALNLSQVLSSASSQLGIGGSGKLASKIPPDAGQIVVLRADQISTAQKVTNAIKDLPVVLGVLVILLYGLAFYLAGPRRRETLRAIGIGLVVAGILALIVRRIAGTSIVDALAASESAQPAAQAVWNIGTSLLVTVATSAISFGILLFLGAWLAGPTKIATSMRQKARPYIDEQPAMAYGAAFVVFILLVAFVPVAAFSTLLGLLVFALLFAAGAELLRRRILAEPVGTESGSPAQGVTPQA